MAHPGLDFYSRNTELVARDLLGKKLVRIYEDGSGKPKRLSGIICETEAYGSKNDPASHAFYGLTNRNSVMFSEVGKSYVYFIYGMHHCMNVTAHSPKRDAGAVLIRSLIPVEGINTMMYLCNMKNKYCGICGEAPSTYEEFAKFLVEEGIESMSLSPDAVIKTILMLAKRKK